ncbi:hypothetical protein SGPA1_30008 [Streptomyces misionensis JCM 4497]
MRRGDRLSGVRRRVRPAPQSAPRDGRGQTVTAPYDYRHRPVTSLTSASVTVTRMG